MIVRAVALTLFVGGLLAGVAYLAFGFLDGQVSEDPAEVAAETADAWLAALTGEDYEAAALLLAPGSTVDAAKLADRHATLFDLSGAAPRAERGELVLGDRVASTDVAWELDLLGADTMAWSGALDLQRDGRTWQVLWETSDLHPELRDDLTAELVARPTVRAPILGRDDEPLAETGSRYEVGIEPRRIQDPAEVLLAFETYAPEGLDEITELLARDDLRPEWWYPVLEIRSGEFESLWPDLRSTPGILRREYPLGRVSPSGGYAQHLLGRYDEITAEKLEEFGDRYEVGDLIGLSGLEARFEDDLVGLDDVEVQLVEPDGDVAAILHTFNGDEPLPVRTSLDVDVQLAVENALVGVETTAAIVAVDASTGAILGSGSRPLGGFNRAWAGQYPPGSVGKLVTLAALLDDGYQLSQQVACPARVVVGGLEIRNLGDRDLGDVPLETAFAESCNTTFARLGAELEDGALERWAEQLGFGADWSHLPFDWTSGQWPTAGDTAEAGAQSVGQGRVLVSPLQVATMMASVEGGRTLTPWLLDEQQDADEDGAELGFGQDRTGRLRAALRSVVTDGTGSAAAVDGVDVRGKTGTAEASTGEDHAWFAGTATFDDDSAIGFAVLVENGGSGGGVAAPLANRFITELRDLRVAQPQ